MTDLSMTIAPKSDQLNADDLIGRTMTITVTGVSKMREPEQPIAISFEGDGGKPYKPGKSMRRVLVNAWGKDGNLYAGRRMTLFRDDKVKFGGEAVGGIRISHLSDIPRAITMALTETRASRKPFTVQPLAKEASSAPQQAQQQSAPTLDAAEIERLCIMGDEAAKRGTDTYTVWWTGLAKEGRKALGAERHAAWKVRAAEADVAEEAAADEDRFPGDDDRVPA